MTREKLQLGFLHLSEVVQEYLKLSSFEKASIITHTMLSQQ